MNKSNQKISRASAAVDYENLLETSFNGDSSNHKHRSLSSSTTTKHNVLPRWERKKLEKLAALNNKSSQQSTGDRYIPNRSGLDLAKHQMLKRSNSSSGSEADPAMDMNDSSQQHTGDFSKAVADSKLDTYTSNLSSALLGVDDVNNSRILSYQDKAPAPAGDTVSNLNILYSASSAMGASKKSNDAAASKLVARHIPSAPSRVLDAPDLLDDYYLNLVDWSATNWLAIALGQTVFLWNAGTGDIEELCTYEDGPNAHIASVRWVQEGGAHLAVGTSDGVTQLWDVHEQKKVRSMDGHTDRVGALAWNRHILTSGSRDTSIVHHDVRIARHNTCTMTTHQQEVCGLSWSPDGETLASGANDNLLCLWDAASMRSQPRKRLTDHQAAVKALAWSPHERNLLASGAGTADRTIKFWNTSTGNLLNSIDTGSQVCALQWNPYEREILSSHGYSRNQLTLWKYPSMAKIKEFEGHTSRVLHMATGPEGCTVSAAADETLRFWDVFAAPASTLTTKRSDHVLKGTKASWTMQIR